MERSKLTDSEIRELFKQGESKDPTVALDKGIIQEIKNASMPKDAEFLSVNLG